MDENLENGHDIAQTGKEGEMKSDQIDARISWHQFVLEKRLLVVDVLKSSLVNHHSIS